MGNNTNKSLKPDPDSVSPSAFPTVPAPVPVRMSSSEEIKPGTNANTGTQPESIKRK